MATTKEKTAEKPKGEVQQQQALTPAPQPRQAGLTFEQFVQEFDGAGRQREITALLPENVPFERFRSTAIAAVKQNPEILSATPRSVFNALTKAAQDGLLPDGREGFINVYNTAHKVAGGKDVWLPTAQWMPMTFGIRKRARELDSLIIDAQVVYLNDKFEWHQGDDPKIVHIPVQLGKDRGEKVGAYAIFKREGGIILHREVMDYGQIDKVKDQSKAKGGLLWTKFEDEAYRKSVVRRGSKTVPVSDNLRQIIQRDDDGFDFSHDGATPAEGQIEGQLVPPRPKESDFSRQPEPKVAAEVAKKPEPAQQAGQGPDGRPEPPLEGELVQPRQEAAQPVQETPQQQPETVREPEAVVEPEEDEQPPSEAYMGASNWLDTAEAGIMDEKDLDDLKKRGRGVIDSFEGLTSDELDLLRGRFTTMVLEEQQRRGKKGKR